VRTPKLLPSVVVVLAILVTAPALSAQQQASGSVQVQAHLASRTSLTVSARTLEFDVAEPGTATVAIEFAAGARVAAGVEVVLSVEPERATLGPGGAADVETALRFDGEGAGTLAGTLAPHAPAVAGRWTGSGLRTGRLTFALHASAPGHYTVPLRFVLSTP
jgi:hypothetical protein